MQGLITSNCTGLCKAGYICHEAATREDEHPCGGTDRYCPTGSYVPTPVTIGYYTTGYPLLGAWQGWNRCLSL